MPPVAFSGNARIDLKSGHVELLAEDQEPAGGELAAPPAFADIKSAPYDLRWCRFVWENKPVTVGITLVALEKRREGEQETLTLKSWDLQTKQPRPPVELIRGRNLQAAIVPESGVLYVISGGKCSVFSWHGVHCFAQFAVAKGTEAVSIHGSRVYQIIETSPPTDPPTEPGPSGRGTRVLRATDRSSGAILWERAIEGRVKGIIES